MPASLFILGLAMAAQALPAQAPAAQESEQPLKISVTAELVLLDVSVRDKDGLHVANLGKHNFGIYENGVLQKIAHFASDDVPVTVGLVIDTSGSMRPKYSVVVTAALSFIHASNRNDEMFVVNFGDQVRSGLPAGVPFTADIDRLRTALSMAIPAGRTALYDAILFSLNHLGEGKCKRKALMLVSDGGDNFSAHNPKDVIRMVGESRATIYTIGILDPDDLDQNPGLLRRLSQISGGESFFPEGLSAVGSICGRIAADIRTRYTIGYVPVRSGEQGAVRKIRVTASTSDGHKLAVHTRTRYFLPDLRPLVVQPDSANRKPGL